MNPRLSTPRNPEFEPLEITDDSMSPIRLPENGGAKALDHARQLWTHRVWLGKALLAGMCLGALVALLIPPIYESTVQLMPPDSQSKSGGGMLAALAAKNSGGVGGVPGGVLGIQNHRSAVLGIS